LKKPTLDKEILKNYRPVSNIPCLSKVIEKVVAERIFSHMQENSLLEEMQSAYKPGHSTESALLRIHNDLLCTLDKGEGVVLVLLDLSAAFDTVDHGLLLSILKDYVGVDSTALLLLQTYLENRTQCISIENVQSELVELVYGVPQGSVLGPIKFCIKYHIYADDTQLYLAFKLNSPDVSISKLVAAISDVRTWMIKNKLKINDDKTEFLVITQPNLRKQFSNLSIQIGPCVVTPSDSATNLGVVFDSTLAMDKHIQKLCQTSLFHLRNIAAIRSLLSESAAAQLVHSLVTTKIDYCNSLLYGLPDCKINNLQRIQNIAARIVSKCSKCDHITPVLFKLHWLPVKYRILFKILVFAYKAYHQKAPKYLCSLVSKYNQARSLRSGSQCLMTVPRSRLKTVGDRAFSSCAPKEWNNLPLNIRLCSSINMFKSHLKTYLFRAHFKDLCD